MRIAALPTLDCNHRVIRRITTSRKETLMKKYAWTAAAIAMALSGAVAAGETSSNPATQGSTTSPSQPNETQPGMGGGATKGDKGGMKGGAKSTDSGKSSTSMDAGKSSGKSTAKGSGKGSDMKGDMSSPNPGNPAEKGGKGPSQPNETQPGMGSVKK
jgi:hypothetical protein